MLSEVETSLAVSEIFRDFSTSPSASLEMTSLSWHEKNRNPIWPGTQFPARICRAGKSKDRRARQRGGVRQKRQKGSTRASVAPAAVQDALSRCSGFTRLVVKGGATPDPRGRR